MEMYDKIEWYYTVCPLDERCEWIELNKVTEPFAIVDEMRHDQRYPEDFCDGVAEVVDTFRGYETAYIGYWHSAEGFMNYYLAFSPLVNPVLTDDDLYNDVLQYFPPQWWRCHQIIRRITLRMW